MDDDPREALRLAKGYDLDLKRTDEGWRVTLRRRLWEIWLGKPFSGSGPTPERAVRNAFDDYA